MRVPVCLLSLALLWWSSAGATEWPHLRGPGFDGRAAAPGTFDVETLGLDVAWQISLGSGYSGIAVAGGRAVTQYSDQEADWIAAFDVETGERLWGHRTGGVFRGLDGSDDGPLSTPVLDDKHAYALTPRGDLIALKLKDGKVAWSKNVKQDFGAEPPHFGFTSTPLLAGSVLVVQTGGEDDQGIIGLDTRSGKKVWSHSAGKVDYQSPALMTLGGRQQIVSVSGQQIEGIAADKGTLLWKHEFGENERSPNANPTFIGEDRFVIPLAGGIAAFRVSKAGQEFEVEELYRSQALGRNYAPPVYHDGHLYGFRGNVLTCANADDGERVWRSRPPGGDGLILVDGHLVIYGTKGNVVVVRATPDGYDERARVQALEGSGLTWPSFADGRVFVRNLEAMAAVSVADSAGSTGSAAAVAAAGHEFGRWIEKLAGSDDQAAMIDALFAKHGTTPLVEGDWLHFVYRSDAEDVAIAGSIVDAQSVEPLTHVEGTDLFYGSYRVEPATRWQYQFQENYEGWKTDPHNPRTVPSGEGDSLLSEVLLPGYPESAHVAEPSGARGKLDTFTLKSEALGADKEIRVWLPPGYEASDASYPLLVVNDGSAWLEHGLMANSLDNLVGESVAPVIVAFVPASRRWWTEAGGSKTEEYARMQATELVPALAERYRIRDTAGAHAVMGNQYFALSAAYAALRHPEVFGKAALQSAYLGLGFGDDLAGLIEARKGPDVRFYLDWNRHDVRNVDRGYDFREDSRKLAEMLEQGGYKITGGEVMDSSGWGGWRNRTDRALTVLFPAGS
jgi:enterochelin esterase-like enzyme/outer membrane protein assembly factor BamB